jgi:hypothetical protein
VVKKLSGDKLKILNHSNPERDMSKAYSSNLTEWQWELIEPLIPVAKPGGRKREVEIWVVLNAIGKKIKGRKRFVTVDPLGLVLSTVSNSDGANNSRHFYDPISHKESYTEVLRLIPNT